MPGGWLVWLTMFGHVGLMLADFNGASFLRYQLSISSMLMSAGFALSTFCYVGVLSLAG